MAFTLPPMNFNSTELMNPNNQSTSVTPMQFNIPWNQTKNYNNKGTGSQSSGQSADAAHGGGSGALGGLGGAGLSPVMIGAIALAAYLVLR